jgi:uncharacterized membrane protein HdeD (DUF308 family)
MDATDEQFADMDVLWDLPSLRRGWAWFVTLGAILVLIGTITLASQVTASLVTAVVIGWLLLFAGAVEFAGAYWSHRWSGFFLHLLSAALSAVLGALFIRETIHAIFALATLLSCLLMTRGIVLATAAGTYQFEGWGWGMVSGSIELILGMMIWLGWPAVGLWMIGLFVGISLMFRGFNWIGLGLAVRGKDWGTSVKRRSIATRISPLIPPPSHAGE